MATIGGKRKTKKTTSERTVKVRKPLKPKSDRGLKRVAKSVRGQKGGYDISNKDALDKYFNKDGSLKQSALRTKKQRAQFENEVKKAKDEIRQLQEENKRLKEENKRLREKARKDRAKKRKQKETYKKNKHGYTQEQYDEFIDILSDVYDETALLFYDSDQVMQMIDEGYTYDDIVNFLKAMNKEKEKNLTDIEKKLLKRKHLTRDEREDATKEAGQMLYLSSKSNLSPEEWFIMKHNDPRRFENELFTILPKDERELFLR